MVDLKHILIADDHPLIRKGVFLILEKEFPGVKISEVQNSKELLAKLQNETVDLVITDLSMPGGGELETIKNVRTQHPALPILALSMLSEEIYAKRVLKAGGSGFVSKDSASEELSGAIRTIHSGKKYISSKLAQYLAQEATQEIKEAPSHDLLSDRELEVFKLLASGKTVSEIAGIIFLSIPTISTYRTRILEKLGLKNNAELMHFALRNDF